MNEQEKAKRLEQIKELLTLNPQAVPNVPTWFANLREWADENGVDTMATEPDSQWVRLAEHVHAQRIEAMCEVVADEVQLQVKAGVQAGDVLVLRIGHNHPAPFNVLAQQLFEEMQAQGRECMVVVTPFGLDNMKPADAVKVLEAVADLAPEEDDAG